MPKRTCSNGFCRDPITFLRKITLSDSLIHVSINILQSKILKNVFCVSTLAMKTWYNETAKSCNNVLLCLILKQNSLVYSLLGFFRRILNQKPKFCGKTLITYVFMFCFLPCIGTITDGICRKIQKKILHRNQTQIFFQINGLYFVHRCFHWHFFQFWRLWTV